MLAAGPTTGASARARAWLSARQAARLLEVRAFGFPRCRGTRVSQHKCRSLFEVHLVRGFVLNRHNCWEFNGFHKAQRYRTQLH